MATLTPGVLSKLLQNVGNTDTKVAGKHRSALLQVIGIVPSLAGIDTADDDPWKSQGFYVRVSDSVHSAYVSVSDEDVNLILTDKIQLGQFVLVSGLDSGSPVPVLRGLKIVPNRRPCIGDPKDLIPSDSLQIPNHGIVFSKNKGAKANDNRRASLGNGKIDGLEKRRLSFDFSRRAWDRSLPAKYGGSGSKAKQNFSSSSSSCSTPTRLNGKTSSVKDLSSAQPNDIAPPRNKNVIVSEKLMTKPILKDLKSSFDCTVTPTHLSKVSLSSKSLSGSGILWDNVSSVIHDLGKEVICHRNVAFLSAVHALEDTSASESILQCMSIFADLCESAQKDTTNPLVEQFLNLYQSIERASGVIHTLLDARHIDEESSNPCRSESSLPEICNNIKNKNSALWIQGAIETNLSKFSLFTKKDKKRRDLPHSEKTHYVILENTPEKTVQLDNHLPARKGKPRKHIGIVSNSGTKKFPIYPRQRLSVTKKTTRKKEEWSKGKGPSQAADLAEKLMVASRVWFLNYLEDSISNEFGLKKGDPNSEVAGLLGQLKRVNQWLNDSVGEGIDERVEGLRKKLYSFLLDHVGSVA